MRYTCVLFYRLTLTLLEQWSGDLTQGLSHDMVLRETKPELLHVISRSQYAIARPSVCCLSVVCRLSVTFVHPTQAIEFSAMFLRHFVPWPSVIFR